MASPFSNAKVRRQSPFTLIDQWPDRPPLRACQSHPGRFMSSGLVAASSADSCRAKSGSLAGIQAAHAPRLARQQSALDAASSPEDMNRPGWGCHSLKGDLAGHWSVSVNENWRLTFTFENSDAILVDCQDYH